MSPAAGSGTPAPAPSGTAPRSRLVLAAACAIVLVVPAAVYLATLAPSVVFVDSESWRSRYSSSRPATRLASRSTCSWGRSRGSFRVTISLSVSTSVPPSSRRWHCWCVSSSSGGCWCCRHSSGAARTAGSRALLPAGGPTCRASEADRTGCSADGGSCHVDRRRNVGALGGVMSLAFARSIWRWAVVTEVYGLHLLLLALALLATLRAAEQPSLGRLLLAAVLHTLPASNHLTAMAFAPVLALYLLARVGRPLLAPRRLLVLACGWLAGLLPYAALPLGAARDPLFNWATPSTGSAFCGT